MIGVLALQGGYAAHGRVLDALGVPWRTVKKPGQLELVRGLVLPGGESTTLIKLMDSWDFWEPLRAFAGAGHPVLGTCAGMILLAREVLNPPQKSLGLIDLSVERNSYGRQRESFEATGTFLAYGRQQDLPMVFIRAPRIRHLGEGVEALATCRGEVVMARQDHILVASFHPELTDSATAHRYFVDMVVK